MEKKTDAGSLFLRLMHSAPDFLFLILLIFFKLHFLDDSQPQLNKVESFFSQSVVSNDFILQGAMVHNRDNQEKTWILVQILLISSS